MTAKPAEKRAAKRRMFFSEVTIWQVRSNAQRRTSNVEFGVERWTLSVQR